MIVGFLHNDNPRERLVAEAIMAGVRVHGDTGWSVSKGEAKANGYQAADVYVMVGVKSASQFHEILRGGAHVLYLDKGYLRHVAPSGPRVWEYWRVSLDSQHPTEAVLSKSYPDDRYRRWGKPFAPWRKGGDHVVIAGSSEKYHNFHGLDHPTAWAADVAKIINKRTSWPIIYRPKPSWKAAVPIDGTTFSGPEQTLEGVLRNAWCLVTHGSNAALDAILLGIPCVVVGGGVAKLISSSDLNDVDDPRLASDDERHRWLSALAYQQWTKPEMASGEMWSHVRRQILG